MIATVSSKLFRSILCKTCVEVVARLKVNIHYAHLIIRFEGLPYGLEWHNISLMKSSLFASDCKMSQNPLRLETEANGALSMACQKAAPYVSAARAAGTRQVYARAWQRWSAWCRLMHATPLPAAPEAVAAWLAELAAKGKSVSTIGVALSAILHFHREAGHALSRTHPAIAAVMAGIARANARPIRRAAPLAIEHLRRLVAGMDGKDLRSLRDRALLLVGFFGALRRSELVALDVVGSNGVAGGNVSGRSFVEIGPQGLVLHLTDTKGNAATQTVVLPRRADELCAAAALERYIAAAGITNGPLFRAISKADRLLGRRLDAGSVRHILRERAGVASVFSPHSLRAGFITSAANAKAPEHLIQRTSRHKSVAVLRSYIRDADAFAASAAAYL